MDRSGGNVPSPPPANKGVSESAPIVESVLLFCGHKEIRIHHGDEVYRLRITSNGKLILNK